MADDPNAKIQRQMAFFLPLISILYGGILPAGLFLYWIVSSIFSIGQQFLILGWGGMFPLFGWIPGFARNHTPRFPVTAARAQAHRTRHTHERGGALEGPRPRPLGPVDDPAQPHAERPTRETTLT